VTAGVSDGKRSPSLGPHFGLQQQKTSQIDLKMKSYRRKRAAVRAMRPP